MEAVNGRLPIRTDQAVGERQAGQGLSETGARSALEPHELRGTLLPERGTPLTNDARPLAQPGVEVRRRAATVRILRSWTALQDLLPWWHRLLERAEFASPHLSPAWLCPFGFYGRQRGEPLVLTAWAEDDLRCLLLLQVRKRFGVRIAEPIGTGLPAYLGLLADPAYPETITALACAWARTRFVDCLCFEDCVLTDTATLAFCQEWPAAGLSAIACFATAATACACLRRLSCSSRRRSVPRNGTKSPASSESSRRLSTFA